jgi:predicted NAD/FAD-binding protein
MAVRRTRGGVEVNAAAAIGRFDEVVFATHSDDSLRLLADPTPAEPPRWARALPAQPPCCTPIPA